MAAFRLYSQTNTFYGESGQVLAGGYVKFYEAGTLVAQDVYGDKALSVNNGSQIDLDAAGHLAHPVWGDTTDGYFVEWYDADDVKQGDEDNVEAPGGAGQTIPVPSAGEYLTGDGTNFAVNDLSDSLLPDPSGHANDWLQTDGSTFFLADGPTDPTVPDLPIVVTANKVTLGATGSDFYCRQWDTDTAPASSTKLTSKSVTFATAFNAAPVVHVDVTGSSPCSTSIYPQHSITAVSTTGFTVSFSTYTGGTSADNYAGSDIINDVAFAWSAEGTIDEPA